MCGREGGGSVWESGVWCGICVRSVLYRCNEVYRMRTRKDRVSFLNRTI